MIIVGGLLYGILMTRYHSLKFSEGMQFTIVIFCLGSAIAEPVNHLMSRPIAIIFMLIITSLFIYSLERQKRLHNKRTQDLAHEIWATAQLHPSEGIEDGVKRIIQTLEHHKT
jgi:undecaprenyl pyrophosphate phosphatase UppP